MAAPRVAFLFSSGAERQFIQPTKIELALF